MNALSSFKDRVAQTTQGILEDAQLALSPESLTNNIDIEGCEGALDLTMSELPGSNDPPTSPQKAESQSAPKARAADKKSAESGLPQPSYEELAKYFGLPDKRKGKAQTTNQSQSTQKQPVQTQGHDEQTNDGQPISTSADEASELAVSSKEEHSSPVSAPITPQKKKPQEVDLSDPQGFDRRIPRKDKREPMPSMDELLSADNPQTNEDELEFHSLEEARAHVFNRYPTPPPDPTVPTTMAQKLRIVAALKKAMWCDSWALDKVTPIQWWQKNRDKTRIEIAAWEILDLMIHRHTEGPSDRRGETSKGRNLGPALFRDRLDQAILALYVSLSFLPLFEILLDG